MIGRRGARWRLRPLLGGAAASALIAAACFSERPDGLTGLPEDCRALAQSVGVPSSHVLVAMRDFAFQPPRVEVGNGTTVTWINCEPVGTTGGLHTATEEDGAWTSALLERGETFSRRFDDAGTATYYCAPHPFMRGEVAVFFPPD